MSDGAFHLHDEQLHRWVDDFTDSHTVGFVLSGSHARGDATRMSDVDLTKFVTDLPKHSSECYVVRFRDENLICVTVTTVEAKLDELKRPETAIWAVPGINQARVLSDPTGRIAELKHAAENFDWSALQSEANKFAANELAGLSEEAHKLFNARESDDGSAAEYAVLGLLIGLTKAAAVVLGAMIPTENAYFRVVRQAAGIESDWSRHHHSIIDASSRGERVAASLSLYVETVRLLEMVRDSGNTVAIDATTQRIENFLAGRKL